MKKYVLLVFIAVLVISGIFIFKHYAAKIDESDLIIEVDKSALTETSEENVFNYYEENKEDFKKTADYLLANEKLFATRPVILNGEDNSDMDKIEDESIKKVADSLLNEGIIKQVSSLNDNIKKVNFLVDSEYGVYEQGIKYVSDPEAINGDKTKYNYVKEYKNLGDGWFYYLYYYNEIKDADVFRKTAWDAMSENDRKSVSYDWNKAIVTLEDWNSVGYKKDNKKRDFVVSVCFNTEVDGLLGPIIAYLDPSTKEVVGGQLRF